MSWEEALAVLTVVVLVIVGVMWLIDAMGWWRP